MLSFEGKISLCLQSLVHWEDPMMSQQTEGILPHTAIGMVTPSSMRGLGNHQATSNTSESVRDKQPSHAGCTVSPPSPRDEI